jgi:hypothetical protein
MAATPHRNCSVARTLVLSQRGTTNTVARCVGWELEDVICEVEGAVMAAPTPTRRALAGRKLIDAGGYRLAGTSRVNPGYRVHDPGGRYDLLFVLCQFTKDLPLVNSLRGWRRRADVAVLWVEELWAVDVGRWRAHTELLKCFDHIIVSCSASADRVEELTGRPCTYLPPGVDALRFSPWPDPPERLIDVMNIGRRSDVTHAALMSRPDLFCYFDTVLMRGVREPAEHRRLYADLVKRSRYFIANPAKFDQPGQTAHQAELGFRYFEGAAGGAVLLGTRPQSPVFAEHFGWEDSVIEMGAHAPHVGDVIDGLDAEPERVAAIRRRNVAESLRRHDWAHRWDRILELVGMERSAAHEDRLDRVAALADEVEAGVAFVAQQPVA